MTFPVLLPPRKNSRTLQRTINRLLQSRTQWSDSPQLKALAKFSFSLLAPRNPGHPCRNPPHVGSLPADSTWQDNNNDLLNPPRGSLPITMFISSTGSYIIRSHALQSRSMMQSFSGRLYLLQGPTEPAIASHEPSILTIQEGVPQSCPEQYRTQLLIPDARRHDVVQRIPFRPRIQPILPQDIIRHSRRTARFLTRRPHTAGLACSTQQRARFR